MCAKQAEREMDGFETVSCVFALAVLGGCVASATIHLLLFLIRHCCAVKQEEEEEEEEQVERGEQEREVEGTRDFELQRFAEHRLPPPSYEEAIRQYGATYV